jgi:hypothetical protein
MSDLFRGKRQIRGLVLKSEEKKGGKEKDKKGKK